MNDVFPVSDPPVAQLDDATIRRLALIDLNLLLVFSVLMQDRSTTLAAGRLFVGQSAVSASLKRLRAVFDDPLLVRQGRGLVATARALALQPQIDNALAQFHALVLAPPLFDPSAARITVRVGMSDDYEIVFLPEIVKALSVQAPHVHLVARPVSHADVCERLDSGEIEVAMSVFGELRSWHRSEVLFEQGYGCLFDKQQWSKSKLSRNDYLSSRQLIVTFDGALRGKIDRLLALEDDRRHVAYGTTRFASLPFLVKGTKLVASLPELIGKRLAQTHGLGYCPLPFSIPPAHPRIVWHQKNESNPHSIWLRRLIMDCVRRAVSEQPFMVSKPSAGREHMTARRRKTVLPPQVG